MSFAYGFGLPHWQPLSGGFNPSSLFVGGVQGTWFDPSDPATLFSDTAGTTPSPTPGAGALSVVGLMLDKSQGLALGSELVTNGDFSNGTTGWAGFTSNPNANATISNPGGYLRVTKTGLVAGFCQQVYTGFVVGKWYKVTVEFLTTNASNLFISDTSNSVSSGPGSTGYKTIAGTYTLYFLATATTLYICLGTTAATADFDNISVKELAGNHAISYNTTTACPVLSARVNLLTYSEQFDNAAWTKSNAAAANITTTPDPLGGTTAREVTSNAGAGVHGLYQIVANSAIGAGVSATWSAYFRYVNHRYVRFAFVTGGGNQSVYVDIDLLNGVIVNTGPYSTATQTAQSIVSVGNGWYRVSVTGTLPSATNYATAYFRDSSSNANPESAISFTALGTEKFLIWGADLRPSNIGTSVPSYQRIADQYTYDSSGFPRYLVFNGIASGMYTPASIPFATVTSDGQARRNLLNNPTQFDVTASWTQFNTTVTANTTVAPDGTTSADSVFETTTNSGHSVYQIYSSASGITYTLSWYVKANGRNFAFLRASDINANAVSIDFVNKTAVNASGTTTNISCTEVANGFLRVSFTFVSSGTGGIECSVISSTDGIYANRSYAGDVTKGYISWGAQLETGSTATAFQNIGTDKATVFAGVRKISDAAAAIFAELSANWGSNNGSFITLAPDNTGASGNYAAGARGSAASGASLVAYSTVLLAPRTDVLTATHDISGDLSALRVNGAANGTNGTGDKGSGNFGTYPLYIGSRANAGSWLNGYLYSLIVVGAASTAAQISSTESWINVKEGTVY